AAFWWDEAFRVWTGAGAVRDSGVRQRENGLGGVKYVLFHKPYGVVSQFSGEGLTLRDFVPVPDVYPVGRLDKDSEGLMLLTDDGHLAHRLTDPRFEHPRTYLVQVERIPPPEALEALGRGVVPADGPTRPADAVLLDAPPAPA